MKYLSFEREGEVAWNLCILPFFFALVADNVLSLAVFAELMRVGTVLLQAIALSTEHFEEISPIDIPFFFVRGACFLPWSARRWTAI